MSDGELRRLFRANLKTFDWLSVETHGTSRGVPDSNFCCRGVDGWIEFKKTDHWRVSISPEQVGWAERRMRHGGRAFLAVRRARTELWLFSATALRLLLTERLDEAPRLGCWFAGPSAWHWERVEALLLGPVRG